MKILLCSAPSIEGASTDEIWQPVGILRVLSWMEEKGYSGDIYDINNLNPSDEELIKNFKQVKPTVVGLSATLSWCYPSVKRITKILRELFPDIWIVLGGNLTSSSNVVLQKTETDICVIGDGEIPFVKLLDYFKLHPTRSQLDYAGLHQIKGLAFIDENNKLKVTGNAEQVAGSEMPYPNLDRQRSGLQKFGGNGELIHDLFQPVEEPDDMDTLFIDLMHGDQKYSEELKLFEKNKNKKIGKIHLSRGCVARCTFCQRATKGYRVYALNHLQSHIIELKEKYNVGGLWIYDENFGSDRKHSYEIARLLKKHDLFWMVQNARVTSFTYEDLKFYKEHNMTYVKFGIESGSQKILDIIEKKTTLKNLYDTLANCKKARVRTNPENMILGMPGETEETVIDSAEFTAELRYLLGMDWTAPNTAMVISIPGTPLYEYSQQIGVIGKTLDEEEDYLNRLCEYNPGRGEKILNYVNKTNSSMKEVYYWTYLYRYAAKKAYIDLIINKNKSIRDRLTKIYKLCIKATVIGQIVNYRMRKKSNKNKKLLIKIKHLTLPVLHLLFSLIITIIPKNILFSIIRFYTNIRFYFLNRNYQLGDRKNKHAIFMKQPDMTAGNFRLGENTISETDRKAERSLRKLVMENRKQMKPAITDEKKGIQILAQGQ